MHEVGGVLQLEGLFYGGFLGDEIVGFVVLGEYFVGGYVRGFVHFLFEFIEWGVFLGLKRVKRFVWNKNRNKM